MYFESFQAVLEMEGHGAFVWAAYAITTAVLALILVLPRRRARRALLQVAGEVRRGQPEAQRGKS